MITTLHNQDGTVAVYYGKHHLCDCLTAFDAMLVEGLLVACRDVNAARRVVREMTVSVL